jgi:hypothetical protein
MYIDVHSVFMNVLCLLFGNLHVSSRLSMYASCYHVATFSDPRVPDMAPLWNPVMDQGPFFF